MFLAFIWRFICQISGTPGRPVGYSEDDSASRLNMYDGINVTAPARLRKYYGDPRWYGLYRQTADR